MSNANRIPKGENGKLLRLAQRAGLTVTSGKKHYKVHDPDGRLLAVVGRKRGRHGPDKARDALRRYGLDV